MKILKRLMFLMVVTLLIGACDEDPVAVTENDVPDGFITQSYTYTVHVVASTENGRAAGLKNATVTVSQKANVKSVKVNESGEAVFTNLSAGAVTFFVKADDFASINKEDYLEPESQLEEDLISAQNDGEHVIELSRSWTVALPRLGASVKGSILADTDRNPATPETPAAGFKVRLQYANTIQPNLFFATVAADGSFQFTNVPEEGATLSTDTVIVINGQNFRFASSQSVSPRVGGLSLPVIKSTNTDPNITFTGTLRFKPWANFDFITQDPTPVNFDQTAEVLPSTATIVVDYSASVAYPDHLQQVFQGTRDVSGVWTFANLPIGNYEGEIKYSHNATYAEGPSCLIVPAGFVYNGGYPGAAAACGAGIPSTYTRTITWNGFFAPADGKVTLTSPNETLDRGAVQLAQ